MSNNSHLQKRLQIGVWVTFASGVMPFVFGLITLIYTWLSFFAPDTPFRALMPPGAPASFTLNEVRQFDPQLAVELITSKHVHYSILLAIGLTIMSLSLFGLRNRLRWSWYLLVGIIVLVGWNDAFTSLAFAQLPVPFVPAIVATIGLYLVKRPIFNTN